MKNNNQAIVRKIARNSLAANKGRNIFIVLAVFLTTLMLGTIISMSVSYMESLETYRIRFEGTIAHIGLINISDEQIEKIKALDYVSHFATGYNVAEVRARDNDYLDDGNVLLVWLDQTNWEFFRKPAFSDIVGTYPQNRDEIMVPSWILNNMGIAEPKIGMDIRVAYSIDNAPVQTYIFKLSGYFTSYVRLRADNIDGMLVSRDFATLSGHTVEKDGNVQIQYVNDKKVTEYNERLAQDLSIDDRDIYTIAKYSPLSESSFDPLFIVFAVLAVFLMLAGYLLIYNVLSISVSRDIRFYGLLKTTGMTAQQIRKSIYLQILYLCSVGVPAGLLFSTLITFIFVPELVTNFNSDIMQIGAVISFNPLIYIGAAVFAVITALTGALIPAQKAARISPIEAVRFSEQAYANRKKIRSHTFNALRTAWRNVFRVRKRAVLVFASLVLGMTLFLTITTILESASIESMLESQMKDRGDIYLRNYGLGVTGENSGWQSFTPEFIRTLESLPGLTEIKTRHIYPIKIATGAFDVQGNVDYFDGPAIGVGKDEIAKLNETAQFSFDAVAFEQGEFIVIKMPDFLRPENEYVNVYFADADDPVPLKIGAYRNHDDNDRWLGGVNYALEIYMSDNLLQQLVGVPYVYDISLYIEKAEQREVLNIIKTLTAGQPDILRASAIESREEMEKVKSTFLMIGGGISVILWLIGVLNFINIITTSILSRRHEIALLESIGQSPKQSRKLLTSEGGIYALITMLLVCVFGGLLTCGLFTLLSKQFDYMVFSFPYVPLAAMVCVVLGICTSVPRLTYGLVSKMTLVERLREVE